MHLILMGLQLSLPYLASQRADALVRACRAEVEWRAVEHDRRLALTGTRSGPPGKLAAPTRSGSPGRPDEQAPGAARHWLSITGAAVAAYAEAVTTRAG
jgi:hypothetical protein